MAEFSFEEALGTNSGQKVPPESDEAPRFFSFEEAIGEPAPETQSTTEQPPVGRTFSFEEAIGEPAPTSQPPVEGNLFREIADIPLGLASGAVMGTRLISDVFGADNPVSQSMKGVEGYLDGLLSAQAKADQQEVARIMQEAEDKGLGANVRAALRAFATSPLDFAAQGLGTAIPALAATIAGGAAGIVTYGVGSGIGIVKDAIFTTVEDEMLKQGVPENEARQIALEAQSYTGDNLDMIALGGALGYLSTRFGIPESVLKNKFGERLVNRGVSQGIVRNMLSTGAREAVPESLQAAQEQFASNLALRREGVDVPLSRGVAFSSVLEGTVGLGIGAGAGALEARVADTQLAERREERRAIDEGRLEVEDPSDRLAAEYNLKPEGVDRLPDVSQDVSIDEKGDVEVPTWFDDIASEVEADTGQEINPEKLGRLSAEYGQDAVEMYVRGMQGEPLSFERTDSAPEIGLDVSQDSIGGIDTREFDETDAQIQEQRDVETQQTQEANQQWLDSLENESNQDIEAIQDKNEEEGLSPLAPTQQEPKAAEATPDQEQLGLPGIDEAPEAQVGRPPIERTPEAAARVEEIQRKQDNQRKSQIRTVEKLRNSLDRGVQKILGKKGFVPFFADPEAFTAYDADPEAAYEARVQRRTQSYRVLGTSPEEAQRRARRDANKQRTAYNEIKNELSFLQDKIIDDVAEVINVANNSRLEGRAAHTAAVEALQDERITPEVRAEAEKRATAKQPRAVISTRNTELEEGDYAPLVPRQEMIDGPIEEATTAEEAMDVLRADTNRTDFERGLAAIFKPIAKRLGTRFQVVQDLSQIPDNLLEFWVDENGRQISAGLFDPVTNTIYIDSVEGLDARTVLHEMIHAGTLNIMNAYEQGLSVPKQAEAAIEEMMELMKQAGVQYQNLLQAGRASPRLQRAAKSTANFTDLAEFASYGITEEAVQNMLLNMSPVSKFRLGSIKTAFSNFADLVRRMLGRPSRDISAFEQLLDLTGRVALEQARTRPKNASRVVQAKKKEEKLSKVQKLQAQQNTLRKFLNRSKGIIASVRDPEQGVQDFLAFSDGMEVQTMQGVLASFTNTMLVKLAEKLDMPAVKNLTKLLANELTPYRSEKLDTLKKQTDSWEEYTTTNKEGGALLEDLLHLSSVFDVLVYSLKTKRFISLKQSINTDPTLRGLKFELQQANQNPSPTNEEVAEMDRLEARIAEREGEIEEIFDIFRRLKETKNKISTTQKLRGYNNSGAEGLRIYAETLQEYENDLNETQALLMDNVRKDPNIPGTEKDKSSEKGKLLAEIVKNYQEIRKRRVYVPLTRTGKYGVRIPGREAPFYMFDTITQRNQFINDYMRDNPGSPRPQIETVEDPGQTLRDQITSDSLRLQQIFKQIDDVQSLGQEGVDALKDTIYQMYLLSLPEGNVRRAYLRRKNKGGYSNDALRAFTVTKLANINQTSRAKFSRRIRNLISEGRAQLEGERRDQPTIIGETPRDVQKRYKEFEKKTALLGEAALRATTELSPPRMTKVEEVLDYASRLGTKYGFVFLLTSARSAIIQPTQLLIFGFGTLHAEYGAGKTSTMASKYLKNFLTLRALGSTDAGPNGEVLNQQGEPAIRNSKYVKSSPIKSALQKAWDYADLRNIFVATRIHDITARAEPEESALRNVATSPTRYKISRPIKFTYSIMTGAIHHFERVSREVFYLSAFELEYEKQLKAGATGDAAIEAAAEKAIDLTNEGMFNYSAYNKPRIAKEWWGRMAYQFQSYRFQALGYIVQNFLKAYSASGLTKKEKKQAAIKFWDTMGMGFVFGGITGTLGYTAFVAMMDGLRDALRPDYDDEDADVFYDVDDEGNALGLRSFDLYIRNNLIPRYFGRESALARQFGIEPEMADLLARGVEMGPISAVTDWNLQPSLELDGLWFRDTVPRDSLESTAVNSIFDFVFGPFGGVSRNILRGFEQIFDGDVARGMETMAPGFFREPMEAYRLSTEGFRTRDGVTQVRDADFYNAWRLIGQTIGFGSTEVAESQAATFVVKRLQAELEEAKNKVYQDYAEAVDRLGGAVEAFGADSKQAAKAKAEVLDMQEEVAKFNYRYFYKAITPEDLAESVTRRLKRSMISTEGLFLNSTEAPFLYPIIKDSRGELLPNKLPNPDPLAEQYNLVPESTDRLPKVFSFEEAKGN